MSLDGEVQASRGEHECQRRKLLPVVVDHEGLVARGAVLVDHRGEVADASGRRADAFDRNERADAVEESAARAGRAADRVLRHVLRQRRVGLALRWRIARFAEHHRDIDVARFLQRLGQAHVAVQCDGRFDEDLADVAHFSGRMVRLRGGRGTTDGRHAGNVAADRVGIRLLVDVEHLVDVREPGILLRLEEEDGVADHLGLGGGELVDQLRLHIARPRPAADVGDGLLVDRDDRDLVAGSLRRHLHAEVIGPALEARDEPGHSSEPEKSECDHQAEKPVGLPEGFLHDSPLSLPITP
jgi:hypothetical protein